MCILLNNNISIFSGLVKFFFFFFPRSSGKQVKQTIFYIRFHLGPNIHWTSNYGTGIVFTGNMLSWLSFHNFV